MYKTIIGVVLMLFIALAVQLYTQEQQRLRIVAEQAAQQKASEQAKPESETRAGDRRSKLPQVESSPVPASFNLPSGPPKEFPIDVNTEQMTDVTVSGHFDVSSGGRSGIDVFIFAEDDYTNWMHGTDSMALYASGRVPSGDLNVRLVRPGRYYLVFKNSAYWGSIDVKTGISVRYEPVPQSQAPSPAAGSRAS